QPKFTVGSLTGKLSVSRQSVPTADQEPGSASKEIRISACEPASKFIPTFANLSHSLANCSVFVFCVLVPSRNRIPRVRAGFQRFPVKRAILRGWADTPAII